MPKHKQNTPVRHKIIRVRVNDSEWNRLHENAGPFKVSPYLRALGLGQQVRKRATPKADPELIRQLARLGNNVNQLAKTANEYRKAGRLVEAVELLAVLNGIDEKLDYIKHQATAGGE